MRSYFFIRAERTRGDTVTVSEKQILGPHQWIADK